jgi:3-oxoacyl-[acyl-carrier protein] reductase
MNLEGKNALVTGGTRGIGRAIVERLAGSGARVAFTYRSSADEAEALRTELADAGTDALALQADAGSADAAQSAVQSVSEAWGSLDILVNNAGITKDTLMIRMSDEDWDSVIKTNLGGVFNYCRAAYRPMMRQRSGRIVNISSIVGIIGNPGQANYAASKAGIIGFSKSLAKELGGRGVTVNVVAPGYIETDMTEAMPGAARAAMLSSVPLGRPGTPGDIAAAVAFLVSDSAAYITGAVLQVDGGLAM